MATLSNSEEDVYYRIDSMKSIEQVVSSCSDGSEVGGGEDERT